MSSLAEAHGYAATEVPAGVTVTVVASGSFAVAPHPPYWPGAGYYLHMTMATGGATGPTQTQMVLYDPNLPDPNTGGSTYQFAGVQIGGWTNSTGAAAAVAMDFSATSAGQYSSGISWGVSLQMSGGPAGTNGCPAYQNSEFYGPNPAQGEQCPACTGSTHYSVNSLTGNEHYDLPGFGLKARGPGIGFGLSYNSLAAGTDASTGHGWSESYGMSIASGNLGTEVVTQEGGATVPFTTPDSGTTWVAPARFNASLVKNSDGTWTFARAHNEIFTFDSTGRLTTLADRNGYKTNLAYGSSGLSSVTDDAGHVMNVAWASGHIASMTDASDSAHPRTISYGYDSNGNLTSYTDIGGGLWTLAYDSSHRLTSVFSPRFQGGTASRQFHYDAQGRVDWEQDPVGNRTTLAYDTPSAGATTITDAAGNARVDYYNAGGQRTQVTTGYGSSMASTTKYAYNGAGMVTDTTDGDGNDWKTTFGDSANPFSPTQTTDPMGRVRTMTYNSSAQLTRLVDANGVTTTHAYDANGNPTTTTVGSGSASPSTTTFNYSDSAHPGQLTSLTDPRGKTWTYAYNAATGTVASAADPLGNTSSWAYNPQGWITSKVTPAGNASGANPANFTTSYTYNAYGQPLTVTDPLSHATTYVYDADGNVASITDPSGAVTAKTWTPNEQLATVTTGSGTSAARTVTYSYTPAGKVASHGYSTATTYTESWNPLGLLASSTDPNGHQTTFGYDANGNLTTTTAAAGTSAAQTSNYIYDADNERITAVAGAGTNDAITTHSRYAIPAGTAPCTGVTNAVYCTTTTSGAGNVTTSFYDALGDLIQQAYPGGKTYIYGYDAAGHQTTATNPAGVTTTSTYNDAGQLTATANGQSADSVGYSYTPDGQRHTMTDATGTTTYNYNNADQMTGIVQPNGDHLTYNRDAVGRTSGLTYPDGRAVGYSYNAAGDMTSLTDGSGGTFNFGYRNDGSLQSKQLPNGDTITTTEDAADQPTGVALKNSGGSTLANLAYSYTPLGQVAAETDTQPGAVAGSGGTLTGAQSYTYDGTGRLKTSTDGTNTTTNYGYDADGNITTLGNTTQAFNSADQLTSATVGGVTTNYSYNSAGDRTQATSSGVTKTYGYDNANRMTSATAPAASPESDYHPIAGGIILDTRAWDQTGTCTGSCTTLTAGGSVTFQVTGQGGIPTNASSVVLNVTEADTQGSGSLVVYPAGTPTPTGRNVTVAPGGQAATAVMTAVSASGQVTITATTATDVIVETAGYYLPAPSASGAAFNPINGTRILDTRSGLGTCTPSPCARISAGNTLTVQVAGRGGIPTTGVVGVAYTLTDYNPSAVGFAVDWPSDQTRPLNASANYTTSLTESALAVTPLSSSGKLNIQANQADVDFTIDLAGYYTLAPDGSSTMYVPFTPATSGAQRILDTSNGTGTCTPSCSTLTSGNPMRIKVTGNVVPANATAVAVSASITTPSASGYLSLWPDGQLGSGNNTLNYISGITSATTAVVPTSQGWIDAETHTGNGDLALDVQGYYISAPWSATYKYNGDNQLTDINVAGSGHNPHFTYDAHTGIAQRINDHTSDYIYGPDGALLETTADTVNSPSTTTAYYLTDSQNTTRAQISADGTIAAATTYTPYGAGGPGYAGGNTETNTGLTYLLDRYYDPTTGTFTTPDPLQQITGQPYAYANNNPTNEADPTGDDPLIGALGGAVLGGLGDLAYQVIRNVFSPCASWDDISWGQVGEASLTGAVYGAGFGFADSLLSDTFALSEANASTAVEASSAAKYAHDLPIGPAEEDAWKVLNRVDEKGNTFPGYKGAKVYQNTDGQLPGGTTYQEWDLTPNMKGVPRDARRLVTGLDGSAYYTTDHFGSFIQIR